MRYKKYDFSSIKDNPRLDILTDAAEIFINDDNLKPNWVEHPAEFTEFYIKRNKKNLLIVIGESWTYGETLRDIRTGIQKYNFYTQLEYCFGARLALMLDTDYYQYAVPGNCNFYMFTELSRILEYIKDFDYEKIYVCLQMTEPSREQTLIEELRKQSHPLETLIDPEEKISFEGWLEEYDNIFLNQYENIISKYNNLDCVLWKNFCRFNSEFMDRKFKTISTSWIQYSANILGKELKSPSFFSLGWLDTIMGLYKNVIFDNAALSKEIDIIEDSLNFIKANSLHSHHPNEFAHILWANYIARTTGWKNDI